MTQINSVICRDLLLLCDDVYKRLNLPKPTNDDHMMTDLVEWILRMPERKPRNVHFTTKLNSKILTPYELQGLQQITEILRTGNDLQPYLSNITSLVRNRSKSQNDFFFSDWGLLHFHLGLHLIPTQKAGRTRRTLYALIKPDDAYLIDVRPHTKDQFGQIEVLEIIAKEWPDLLDNYKLKSILAPPAQSQLNADEIIVARRSGISSCITINNEVYIGPGGGVSTDSSSTCAVLFSNQIRRELAEIGRRFHEVESNTTVSLFVNKDASIGFFNPKTNIAHIVCLPRTSQLKVTWFFRRLIDEAQIFKGAPDGAMWCL